MAPRSIFVNLPVCSPAAATEFYLALGATKNLTFSDVETSCLVLNSTINLLIMTHDRFADFLPNGRELATPTTSSAPSSGDDGNADGNDGVREERLVAETLLCLTVDSMEEVDDMVENAGEAGGKMDPTFFPVNELMYGRSFEDLDGYIWQVIWVDEEEMTLMIDQGVV